MYIKTIRGANKVELLGWACFTTSSLVPVQITKLHIIFQKFLQNLSPDKYHNIKFSSPSCLFYSTLHAVVSTGLWGLSGFTTAWFMIWGGLNRAFPRPGLTGQDGQRVAGGPWRVSQEQPLCSHRRRESPAIFWTSLQLLLRDSFHWKSSNV